MDYVVKDTELTGIADAIRDKGSTTDKLVFPDGFSKAISEITTGGKDTLMERLKGNAVELVDDEITYLPSYSMEESKVTKWNMPKLTAIWNYTFSYADLTELYDLDTTNLQTIALSAFGHCTIRFVKDETFQRSGLTIQNVAFQFCKFQNKDGTNLDKLILAPGRLTQACFTSIEGITKVWISQNTTITGTAPNQALFLNSTGIEIYTNATEKPSKWGNYFNYLDTTGTQATVHYGVSLEEFKAL